MIRIPVPGRPLELTELLLDLNGTITRDGLLLGGVSERLDGLRDLLRIEIASGDTFGTAAELAESLSIPLTRVSATGQAEQKAQIVRRLGPESTVMIGNGANDARALEAAALGICVIGSEGAARDAVLGADIIVPDALVALDLLLHPQRAVGTLRD